MADADLHGWASIVADGGALVGGDLASLISASERRAPVPRRAAARGALRLRRSGGRRDSRALIQWLRKVGQRFVDLGGTSITGWSGIEVALRDLGDDDRPQFEESEALFSQLLSLDVDHGAGRSRVTCSQNDDVFGLCIEPVTKEGDDGPVGILRSSAGFDAPVGVVEDVMVTVEEAVIAEVGLTVAGRQMLLIPGEVEEGQRSRLTMRRLDESVLLFPDAVAAEGLAWVPPRHRADGATRRRVKAEEVPLRFELVRRTRPGGGGKTERSFLDFVSAGARPSST